MAIKKFESDDEHEVAIEAKETRKANTLLWYSYDAADNFFSQCVISLAFTPYAMLLGVMQGWTLVTTFIVVSLFMAGSNLLIAIFGPMLGAISDTAGKRKPAVLIVASIMVTTTALTVIWVNFWWASILFVIGNFCYQAGRMFYDSQIPFVTDSDKRSLYQAIGGALAPIGSFVGIGAGLLSDGIFGKHTSISTAIWELTTQEIQEINYNSLRWLFAIAAGVLILMCLPYLFHKEVENPSELSAKENIKESFISIRRSFKTIVSDRNSWLFFLAWFFTVDAANTTILYMVPVVEGACGVADATSLGGTLTYIVIGVGILLSVVFGIVTGYMLKYLGNKLTFIISGFAWMIAVILFMFAGWVIGGVTLPWWISLFGAFFIGIGFGGVWIIGRQFIMVLAPPSKLAQYAGFQKIAGRVSAIVSPLIFASMMFLGARIFVGPLTANYSYRLALGSIVVFFIIGIIFMLFIVDPHKRYLAGERAPYPGIYDKSQASKKVEES
ncbi:MAG TPA: MFS transporter [candidate division Zixibacteria bacterium]|nr:MFS transporter [candidate division Zixibacteria bacterium]